MNNNGEIKILSLNVAMLAMFLFIGIITATIAMVGSDYDLEGYDESDLSKYNKFQNLSADIQEASNEIDNVVVDPSLFDFFAGIFNSVLRPFKFIYRSFGTLITMSINIVSDFKLLPVLGDFFAAVITLIIVVGIVMIKFYLGKQK